MQRILTPTGPRPIESCQPGDAVIGAHGINRIQSIQRVDESEWERWHKTVRVPNFLDYDINGGDIKLFGEQSIFHNDGKVTHARLLRPGNVIFHRGRPVRVKRIRQIDGKPWQRLEIDGDHSFIGDGLRLHNASRFWVLGTGTWDASTTTNWAASSGGAGGSSVPGSADTVTIDGASGAGTVTPNTTVTVQSITCGAMGMTLDFSANNNNVTLSSSSGFSGSGTGTRTINLGNGTWTLSGTIVFASSVVVWSLATTTNLTFNANSSTISLTGNSAGQRAFSGGGKTYRTVSLGANSSGGGIVIIGNNTSATMSITGQNVVMFTTGSTTTITNAFTWSGSSGSAIFICSGTNGLGADVTGNAGRATISVASGSPSLSWAAISEMAFTGGATFTASSSFNLGNNTGITITAPSTAGGFFGRYAGAIP